MDVKIEKGIPIPLARVLKARPDYARFELQDSYMVECDLSDRKAAHLCQARINNTVRWMKKKGLLPETYRVTTRRVREQGSDGSVVEGVRVWRVA